jgi:hypothetical protein
MMESDRIHRWIEHIQNYSFKVEYQNGEEIPHVDALSRHSQENEKKKIQQIQILTTEEEDQIIKECHERMIHRGKIIVQKKLGLIL